MWIYLAITWYGGLKALSRLLSGLGVRRTECLALLRIGFQVRPFYQVDAVRDGREHGVQAVVDRGGLAGQVDDQALAAYPGGLP